MTSKSLAITDDSLLEGVGTLGGGFSRSGVPGREHVSDIQRARMLAAMVEIVGERGAGGVTVAHVVARSSVSRRTFYEIFKDREDCFLAAFDDALEKIAAVVIPEYEREVRWREKIRAGLVALLGFLEDERGTGRLLIVETLAAGPGALERRGQVLAEIVDEIDAGLAETRKGEAPSGLSAEGVVGAVLSVLHTRLLANPPVVEEDPQTAQSRSGGLLELLNPLMAMIVLPYLGSAASRRELERPIPKRPAAVRRAASTNPLRDLQMRLTYRTVRVLTAVGANPGSSNRTVGDAAGMSDQGQTSKLLARLQGLGLVENLGADHVRGGPNAWTLTPKGWEIHAAISTEASAT
jgi:AcrR family transcriptional regulator